MNPKPQDLTLFLAPYFWLLRPSERGCDGNCHLLSRSMQSEFTTITRSSRISQEVAEEAEDGRSRQSRISRRSLRPPVNLSVGYPDRIRAIRG